MALVTAWNEVGKVGKPIAAMLAAFYSKRKYFSVARPTLVPSTLNHAAQASSVTVALASTARLVAVALSPATLTFTMTNWNTAQTVQVSVPNNNVVGDSSNETVTLRATSTDAAFNNLAGPNITVQVQDNDMVR